MPMLSRPFGRDEHAFVLTVAGWREVEKTCDAGLGVIAARLKPLVDLITAGPALAGGLPAAIGSGYLGSARLDDVREPILQGLIGGGMTSTLAGVLVRAEFDALATAGRSPMVAFALLAWEIVMGAIIGLPDEPLGESVATSPPKARRRSPTGKHASPTSTPPPPS